MIWNKEREKYIYTCWQESETIRKASHAGGRNKQQPIRLGGAVSRCLRRARGGVRCEQECIIVFPARVALRPRAVHDTFLAHIFSRNLSSWFFFFLSCFISRLFFFFSTTSISVRTDFQGAYFRLVTWRLVNLNSWFLSFLTFAEVHAYAICYTNGSFQHARNLYERRHKNPSSYFNNFHKFRLKKLFLSLSLACR